MKNTIEDPLKITQLSFPDGIETNKTLPVMTPFKLVDLSVAQELKEELEAANKRLAHVNWLDLEQFHKVEEKLSEQSALIAEMAEALEIGIIAAQDSGDHGREYEIQERLDKYNEYINKNK